MSNDLQTINIKGKNYVLVNERIKYFRSKFKDWSLTTEVVKLDSTIAVMKAEIKNPEGRLMADGYAYEKADSSFINKTSYIENCQTSAWGRALGNLGIGIDENVCSAEELVNAISNQEKKKSIINYEIPEELRRTKEEKEEDKRRLLEHQDKLFNDLKESLMKCTTEDELEDVLVQQDILMTKFKNAKSQKNKDRNNELLTIVNNLRDKFNDN